MRQTHEVPLAQSIIFADVLHIENVKEVCRASNRVPYEEQMLWYNDRPTRMAYMLQTFEHLALSGIHDPDTAKVLSIQTRNQIFLSTWIARHRERGPEICQQAFRARGRPNQNLAPAISFPIQVPERKQ